MIGDRGTGGDHELVVRVRCAQATRDEWFGKAWRMGEADCARMAASHLRRMGHAVKLPAKGRYRTVKSARAELLARGFANLPEAMDAMGFERIVPARAIVGDVMELPEEEGTGIGSLVIALGNGRVLGWHPDVKGAAVLQPGQWQAAWRVTPTEKAR